MHLVAPTCVVVKDDKVLILKRADHEKVYPGKWTVPGGKMERSEYEQTPKTTADAWYGIIEETVRREVREESALEVDEPRYLLSLVFIRPDDIPVVTISYWAYWKSGDVVLDRDHSDFAWVTPDEAATYDMIEGIAEEIAEVGKLLS